MITIKVPVSLGDYNTLEFLKSVEVLFQYKNSSVENFKLRCDRVQKISLFSQLLLYKFINYSNMNKCFRNPHFSYNQYLIKELVKSGFWPLIESHLQDSKLAAELFEKYQVYYTIKDLFFLAPIKLMRSDNLRFKHIEDFTQKVNSFYEYNMDAVSLVSTCLCEIYMNFWEHATEDSGTIMVAQGDKKIVEIMFADNGEGIKTNLLRAGYGGKKILEQAIKRGVTSKKGTDHMGWGLWLVSQLCISNNGYLEIFSEGEALVISNGRITCNSCGYWKGTIIHLKLPVTNPKLISDLRLPELKPSIKIRWS